MASVFINEFHYDNTGADTGEFVEVTATAGTDLTGYSLVLYNGNGGAPYGTTALSGTIANQEQWTRGDRLRHRRHSKRIARWGRPGCTRWQCD